MNVSLKNDKWTSYMEGMFVKYVSKCVHENFKRFDVTSDNCTGKLTGKHFNSLQTLPFQLTHFKILIAGEIL